MTPGRFAGGTLLIVAALMPVAWGSVRLRRRIVPHWTGATARLFEAIIGIAGVMWVCQLLGVVGAFRRWPLLLSLAATGLLAGGVFGASSRANADARSHETGAEAQRSRGLWMLIAVLAVSLIAGHWVARTSIIIAQGTGNVDSLTYHLPHAARFIQDGSITELHHTDPDYANAFQPSDAELAHALGMTVYGRDVLLLVLNVGWLALALLAAWCVGRPFGTAPATFTAAALVLGLPIVVFDHAATASDDIAAIGLLLAAVAMLVQPDRRNADLTVAGIAAGLALSTKLTVVGAVVALVLGMCIVERRLGWKRVALTWLTPVVAAGGFWYLRNLVRTGSPLPGLPLAAGPLPFSSAEFPLVDEYGFTVAHYLGDGSIWREWFLPGLRFSFGPLWWLVIASAAVAVVLAIAAGRRPVLRMLGVVAAISAAGYLVTPTTAYGPEGKPIVFSVTLMYLAPALALGLVLLPVLPVWSAPGRGRRLLLPMAAAISVAFLASTVFRWPGEFRPRAAAAAILSFLAGLALIRGRVVVARFARSRTWLGATVAAALVLATIVGYPLARNAQRNAYKQVAFWRWARPLSGERIAIAGFTSQYPLYGVDLSNHVQYVGRSSSNGEFTFLRSCSEWRKELRQGRFTFVALKHEIIITADIEHRELPWTLSDPAATELLRADGGVVFRFDPRVPDPGCGSAGALSGFAR